MNAINSSNATNAISKPGPIATKLIAAFQRYQNGSIVAKNKWDAVITTRAQIRADMHADVDGKPKLLGLELYNFVESRLIAIFELLKKLPELAVPAAKVAKGEDIYWPQGPPMSPLTQTCFWQWMLYDVGCNKQDETIASILLALGRALDFDPGFLEVASLLNASRLGLYGHAGRRKRLIILRELVGDGQSACVCAFNYGGKPGELWLVRVLPPLKPFSETSVVMHTPYIVANPGVAEWQEYLRRTLPKMKQADDLAAYAALMKYGLVANYWMEYIFEAYSNHTPDAITLYGLPDVDESRPHSKINSLSGLMKYKD